MLETLSLVAIDVNGVIANKTTQTHLNKTPMFKDYKIVNTNASQYNTVNFHFTKFP